MASPQGFPSIVHSVGAPPSSFVGECDRKNVAKTCETNISGFSLESRHCVECTSGVCNTQEDTSSFSRLPLSTKRFRSSNSFPMSQSDSLVPNNFPQSAGSALDSMPMAQRVHSFVSPFGSMDRRLLASAPPLETFETSSHYSSQPSTPRAFSATSMKFRYWRPDTASVSVRESSSLREVQRAVETEVAALRRELIEFRKQNDILRQETRSLQQDNAILLSQLDDQTMCLAGLAFDAERYRTKLEEEKVDVPVSLYAVARAATKIPRTTPQSGKPLPEDLIQATQLSPDESANFKSIHALVNTVNELQVRMREAHLRSASAAEDRVAEFQQLVSNVEAQLEEVQRSREAMRARFEEDLLSMTRKKDSAVGRLGVLEAEINRLQEELEAAKRLEAFQIEELKLGELEQKVAALQGLLEERSNELAALRNERNTILAASVVSGKENEYYIAALERERAQNEELRRERDSLNDELNATKTSYANSSTQLLLLQGRLELIERVADAKEAEIEQWKKRSQTLQEEHTTEATYWDKSLQESMAHLSKTELKLEAAQEQVLCLEAALAGKEQQAAASLAEKEECLASMEARLRQTQALLEEEVACRALAQRRVADVELALKNQTEERQVLVDRIVLVEKQAVVLKERHPTFNFEVLEEEVQQFEEERQTIMSNLHALEQEKGDLTRRLGLQDARVEELQLTVQRQGERLEEKLAQLQLLENECVCFKAERDAAQQEAEQSRQILEEKSKALADNIGLLKQREARCIELEAQLSALTAQQVAEKQLFEKELEDLRRQLELGVLDTENSRQAHRLEIQAHSRDLQRIETLTEQMKTLQKTKDDDLEEEKRRTVQLRAEVVSADAAVSAIRRQLENVEAEKQLLKNDNENMRLLLNEKLDALEIEDSESLKAQLSSRLRAEEALRRHLDTSRVDAERLKLELNALQATVRRLQDKAHEDAVVIEKLRTELDVARDAQSVAGSTQHEEEIALLRMRLDRLGKDHQYQLELRRNAEKQLNAALSETEPLRRREALLQGEIVNLTSTLSYASQDAELYKSKFFTAIKGQEAALEAQSKEANAQIAALQAEKTLLEDKIAGLLQQTQEAEAHRDAQSNELQQTQSEVAALRSMVDALQSELQGLRTAAQKQQQQQQKMVRTDNPEIQRRYQLQLSNLQRLLQQVNAEKEALQTELNQARHGLSEQQAAVDTAQQEVDKLRISLARATKNNLLSKTKPDVSPSASVANCNEEQKYRSVTEVVSDVVRLAVLSAVLAKTSSCFPSRQNAPPCHAAKDAASLDSTAVSSVSLGHNSSLPLKVSAKQNTTTTSTAMYGSGNHVEASADFTPAVPTIADASSFKTGPPVVSSGSLEGLCFTHPSPPNSATPSCVPNETFVRDVVASALNSCQSDAQASIMIDAMSPSNKNIPQSIDALNLSCSGAHNSACNSSCDSTQTTHHSVSSFPQPSKSIIAETHRASNNVDAVQLVFMTPTAVSATAVPLQPFPLADEQKTGAKTFSTLSQRLPLSEAVTEWPSQNAQFNVSNARDSAGTGNTSTAIDNALKVTTEDIECSRIHQNLAAADYATTGVTASSSSSCVLQQSVPSESTHGDVSNVSIDHSVPGNTTESAFSDTPDIPLINASADVPQSSNLEQVADQHTSSVENS